MATTRDVLASMAIRIGVDSANMSKSLNKITGDMNLFKGGLKMLGGAIAAAFSVNAIANFGKASINSFMESEKAISKMRVALKGNADELERFKQLATQRQGLTVFSDEDSLNAMARMRSLLGDNEEAIRRLLPVVQDFATVKEMGLSEAADMVARSVASGTNALKRQGIEIVGAAGSSERLESAVNSLTKAFGGQAKALGETLYGQLQRTKNAWDDIKESIGAGLSPVIIRSSQAWQIWAEGMRDAETAWDKWRITFTSTSKLIEMYNDKYGALADNVERLKKVAAIKYNADGTYTVPDAEHGGSGLTGTIPDTGWNPKKPTGIPSIPRSENYPMTQIGNSKGANLLGQSGIPDIGMETSGQRANEWEKTYQGYKDFAEKMKATSADINAAIKDTLQNLVVDFAEGIGTMVATGEKLDFSFIVKSFASLAKQVGTAMIAFGVSGIALKQLIKNPYLSIAAGAALVALGAAANATISNMANSKTSSVASMSGASMGSSSDYSFNRNLGDLKPITINVVGKIDGNDIRLSYDRSKSQHNNGY